MYMRQGEIAVILALIFMLLTGCSNTQSTVKTYEMTTETEEPIPEAEPIEEDALSLLISDIQDEMRVFDVVEHHEDLYALIKADVDKNASDEVLNEAIGLIVKGYMDEQLDKRIREGLSAIQEPYLEEDVAYVRERINTHDLYELITIYEREFLKKF